MDIAKMQSAVCSAQDLRCFCGVDRVTWNVVDSPVIHQGAKLLLVLQGKGRIRINGREYLVQPNAVISILPWDLFQVTSLEKPIHCRRLRYQFQEIIGLIKNLFNISNSKVDFIANMEKQPVLLCTGETLQAAITIYDTMEAELNRLAAPEDDAAPLSTPLLAAKLVEVITLFLRLSLQQSGDHMRVRAAEPECDPHNAIFHYIATHLNEKITLGRLSFELGLTEDEIRSYIISTTGLSLSDLLNEMRVVTSVNYLLYSDLTLEELSDILGFADASHMSKVFATRMGEKLTQYRKTYTLVNRLGKIRLGRKGIDIVVYIYRHYREPLSASWVADLFSITVNELNQTLLYQVEKNFAVFLNSIRIRKACVLLATTDKSILDVAMEVGFNSIKTFNRQFLRLMGSTPGSFRKAHVGASVETEWEEQGESER